MWIKKEQQAQVQPQPTQAKPTNPCATSPRSWEKQKTREALPADFLKMLHVMFASSKSAGSRIAVMLFSLDVGVNCKRC